MRSGRWGPGGGLLLVALATGCASTRPPAPVASNGPGFVYQDGWGWQCVPAAPLAVREAAEAAACDLGMSRPHRERSGAGWMLDARAHDGRHVRLSLQPDRLGTSSIVAARVGRRGDEALSRAWTERIQMRLGLRAVALPPETPPTTPGTRWFSREAVPDAVMFAEQVGSQYRENLVP